MSEREEYYDRVIAPALKELAADCKANGLSFLAVVEWEPGEHGRTANFSPPVGLGIRLADVAAQANGNVDGLILAIMRYARENGHNSACLSVLGIPTATEGGG
jgi:hypothetical protein